AVASSCWCCRSSVISPALRSWASPRPTLFPYTTLFRSREEREGYHLVWPRDLCESAGALLAVGATREAHNTLTYLLATQTADGQDRKSTRLNSSHLVISYAVFCLKKKNIYRLAKRLDTV